MAEIFHQKTINPVIFLPVIFLPVIFLPVIFLPVIFLPFKIDCVARTTFPRCVGSLRSPGAKIFGRNKNKKTQKGRKSLIGDADQAWDGQQL